MQRIIVMAGDSLGGAAIESCWEWCVSLASSLGEDVLLATMDEGMVPVSEFVFLPGMVSHGEIVRPAVEPEPAAMSAAPFVYRDDGRPDWSAMWSTFCELALFGGPPHRGEDSAIVANEGLLTDSDFDAMAETQRGIFETTGLSSVPGVPGWLAVECDSTKMAAWLCAAIVLENVEARVEGCDLLVPARPDYELQDEVKSVITVVAKTHHYWLEHASEQIAAPACRTRVSDGAMRQARLLHAH